MGLPARTRVPFFLHTSGRDCWPDGKWHRLNQRCLQGAQSVPSFYETGLRRDTVTYRTASSNAHDEAYQWLCPECCSLPRARTSDPKRPSCFQPPRDRISWGWGTFCPRTDQRPRCTGKSALCCLQDCATRRTSDLDNISWMRFFCSTSNRGFSQLSTAWYHHLLSLADCTANVTHLMLDAGSWEKQTLLTGKCMNS